MSDEELRQDDFQFQSAIQKLIALQRQHAEEEKQFQLETDWLSELGYKAHWVE